MDIEIGPVSFHTTHRLEIELGPETRALLTTALPTELIMATLEEVRTRLDEVKRLLGVEKDQAAAKDQRIADLERDLATRPTQDKVDELAAAVEEIAAAVPDTVDETAGTGTATGTVPGTANPTGTPTGTPTDTGTGTNLTAGPTDSFGNPLT